MKEIISPLGTKIEIEPGRSIVGNAGLLVSRVINVKAGVSRKFVIVDAAMNDLIRPSLYDAYHGIIPVAEPASDAPVERCDVVGPICETGDRFAEQRPLPPVSNRGIWWPSQRREPTGRSCPRPTTPGCRRPRSWSGATGSISSARGHLMTTLLT